MLKTSSSSFLSSSLVPSFTNTITITTRTTTRLFHNYNKKESSKSSAPWCANKSTIPRRRQRQRQQRFLSSSIIAIYYYYVVATHLYTATTSITRFDSTPNISNNQSYSNNSVMAYSISSIAEARKKRLVNGSNDVLFGHIEQMQGTKPFGSFLDAGTGIHSLRWLSTLGDLDGDDDHNDVNSNSKNSGNTSSNDNNGNGNNNKKKKKGMTDFIAVTADESMRKNVQREADQLGVNHLGKIVIGNWFPSNSNNNSKQSSLACIDRDENNTPGGKQPRLYDTIVADYLIGSMDGFSPYQQDQMIDKLAQRLQVGGRLYIIGLEPIPDSYNNGSKNTSPQNIICDVRRVRDACILLSGERCYREYPVEWIQRQITEKQSSQHPPVLKLVDTQKFPILYRHSTIVKQITVARNKLSRFPSKALANEMTKTLNTLEQRSYDATEGISSHTRIQLGFDYVVTAERIITNTDYDNKNENDDYAR